MADRDAIDALDKAIEAAMTNPDDSLLSVDERLAGLLRIAGDLCDLPSGAFRARLKADLLGQAQRRSGAAAPPDYGQPLMTVEDYLQRLDELRDAAPLAAYDLETALRDLPVRGSRFLAMLNECAIGVGYLSKGAAHWERHAGDELLHILSGEAEVVTVTAGGPVRTALGPGALFICPRGLWHRVEPRSESLSMFFATPEDTTATDRPEPPTAARRGRPATPVTALRAHGLRQVLHNLPELAIGPDTTGAEADAAVRPITTLGPCSLGVMRYSGLTPWERHPDGDELLHVLEGAVGITVLTESGPRDVLAEAGSVFVCPRGLWHRQLPRPSVTMLFATPTRHGEVSFADDPRVG